MVRVGEIRTLQYDVSGRLYVVDEYTLKIEDFNYNGKGPDAFFYVGESGGPSGAGTMVPYPEGSDTVLTKADKIDITLRLPTGVTSTKLKWLSVWCRQYSVNFGDVMFDKVILTATSSSAASTSSEKPPKENLESQVESRATKIDCPILILTT